MDESVVRAMARWPNVPAVYGWLSLDRRGRWLIKSEPIANTALRAFISRNYVMEDDGACAFQNGPQRVYVALEYTPFVTALDGDGALRLHTGGLVETIASAHIDETGSLLLGVEGSVALLDDRDLEAVIDAWVGVNGEALDDDERERRLTRTMAGAAASLAMRWQDTLVPIGFIASEAVAERFGFTPAPQAPA